MEHIVIPTRKYTITANQANCVVTDAKGRILATVKPGQQVDVTATTGTLNLSDACAGITANFHNAPAGGGSSDGGGSVSPSELLAAGFVQNTATTSGSLAIGADARADESYSIAVGRCTGAVSGGVAVGSSARVGSPAGVAIGEEAFASPGVNGGSVAVGGGAHAADESLAVGGGASTSCGLSAAIGLACIGADEGTLALGALSRDGKRTQFYLVASGSRLANQYLADRAGIGFIVYNADNAIIDRGVVRLDQICVEYRDSFDPGGIPGSSGCGCGC